MSVRLYSTTYPAFLGRRYMWFNAAVYRGFFPNVGNLPVAVFRLLQGGRLMGGYREYESKEEAVADLIQTGFAVPLAVKSQISCTDWCEPLNFKLILRRSLSI
jgi:hypothetical protein